MFLLFPFQNTIWCLSKNRIERFYVEKSLAKQLISYGFLLCLELGLWVSTESPWVSVESPLILYWVSTESCHVAAEPPLSLHWVSNESHYWVHLHPTECPLSPCWLLSFHWVFFWAYTNSLLSLRWVNSESTHIKCWHWNWDWLNFWPFIFIFGQCFESLLKDLITNF